MALRIGEVVVAVLPPTEALACELVEFLVQQHGREVAVHAHHLHPLAVGFQLLHLGVNVADDGDGDGGNRVVVNRQGAGGDNGQGVSQDGRKAVVAAILCVVVNHFL